MAFARAGRNNQGKTIVIPSPGVAVFIGFAAKAKPVRFDNIGASVLHTLLLVLILVTRR